MNKYGKDDIRERAATDAHANGRYVPNPEVQRRDRWITPTGDMDTYNKAREEVNTQIHAMKAKLLTILRARAEAHHVGDKEHGVLDTASLYSLRLGNKRVFSERTKAETLDTAISIVIDLSGSMIGEKSECTKRMAIALGETFQALNIPFEIIGFHNPHAGGVSYCPPYSRYMPFEYHVFKAFGERYQQVRERLSTITGHEENVDGEAVLACAMRLAARPETRKIMFVLSDGQPIGGCDSSVAAAHLNDVVKMITASGIEVFGIGAMTECVKRFYGAENGASYIVINNINQLAVEVYKLMRSRLLGFGRRAA
jgi:cobaltochelatase CobT